MVVGAFGAAVVVAVFIVVALPTAAVAQWWAPVPWTANVSRLTTRAIADDTYYYVVTDCTVPPAAGGVRCAAAINSATGATAWEAQFTPLNPDGGWIGGIFNGTDAIYATGANNVLLSFSKADGSTLWGTTFVSFSQGFAAVVEAGDRVYVCDGNSYDWHAVLKENGRHVAGWSLPCPDSNPFPLFRFTAFFFNHSTRITTAIALTQSGDYAALDVTPVQAGNFTAAWFYDAGGQPGVNIAPSRVLLHGAWVLFQSTMALAAVDLYDGTVRYSFSDLPIGGAMIQSGLSIVSPDHRNMAIGVAFSPSNGTWFVLNAWTGAVSWSLRRASNSWPDDATVHTEWAAFVEGALCIAMSTPGTPGPTSANITMLATATGSVVGQLPIGGASGATSSPPSFAVFATSRSVAALSTDGGANVASLNGFSFSKRRHMTTTTTTVAPTNNTIQVAVFRSTNCAGPFEIFSPASGCSSSGGSSVMYYCAQGNLYWQVFLGPACQGGPVIEKTLGFGLCPVTAFGSETLLQCPST